jgi:hypothetical protein
LQVSNQPLQDAFNVVNALFGGGPTPIAARASFDVRWHGGGDRNDVEDAAVGFSLHAVQGDATIDWSASNADGFTFISSAAGQTTAFAEVGKERNGVFFA